MEVTRLKTELEFLKKQKEIRDYFDENTADEILETKIKMQELLENLDPSERSFNTKLYNWFGTNYPT